MKKILIVDDSEDIHDLFASLINSNKKASFMSDFFFDDSDEDTEKKVVNSKKYKILHATQGEEALELIINSENENDPIDLIFMDMNMPPGIDGITTINKLAKKVPNKKVVVCSAFLNKDWDSLKKNFKGDATLYFLRKPFSSKKIHRILAEALK